MPVEKTTPIRTITTITLVLSVYYFLVLFEVTPMINIRIDVLPVYNTSRSTTGNTASIIQTITATSTSTSTSKSKEIVMIIKTIIIMTPVPPAPMLEAYCINLKIPMNTI